MRRFVPLNSSKISACATGWRILDCANTTSINTALYLQQNSPGLTNSTQWLGSLRQNELGVQLLGSLTTVKRKLKVRKGFLDSKSIVARSNTKRVAGSFHLIGKLSLSEMART